MDTMRDQIEAQIRIVLRLREQVQGDPDLGFVERNLGLAASSLIKAKQRLLRRSDDPEPSPKR